MPTRFRSRLLPVALTAALVASAHAQPASPLPAGRVKAAAGTASILRSGQAVPAVVGAPVHESDVLKTGKGGQLAVMMKDETRLSLGPDTEVALNAFAFAPAEGRLTMVLRMLHGALSYVSGRIAKLNPGAVRIETPSSVIGVRGTHALIRVDVP